MGRQRGPNLTRSHGYPTKARTDACHPQHARPIPLLVIHGPARPGLWTPVGRCEGCREWPNQDVP